MLVSPSEHKLKGLGKASALVETYGADFLFPGSIGLVGVQRKEIKDYVASLRDGRLAKELGQMKALQMAILVLEGELRWGQNGQLLSVRTTFTYPQFVGSLLSIQSLISTVMFTSGLDETRLLLPLMEKWVSKQRHGSLSSRPNPTGEWGNTGSRDWGVHILQSFSGIGLQTAGNIYDHCEGVPLAWTISRQEMMGIRGVGKGRAETLYRALERQSPPESK